MTTMKTKTYGRLNRIRQASQILSLALLFAIPLLTLRGITVVSGNLYSLSIGALDIVDPMIAAQAMALTKQVLARLLWAALLPISLALVFGKIFCSWACPFNALSEWIAGLQRMTALRRRRDAAATIRNPRRIVFFGIFAVLALCTLAVGIPLLSYLSAPGILSTQIGHLILGGGIGADFLLIGGILLVEALIFRRFWCKYICPVGAGLAIFRVRSTLSVRHERGLCACSHGLEPCGAVCPLDLNPKRDGVYPSCFNCGLCLEACERTGHGALRYRLGQQPRPGVEVAPNTDSFGQA